MSDTDSEESKDIFWWNKTSAENQWFLLAHALNLAKFREPYAPNVKNAPRHIYAVLAKMLCGVVEERLRRNLSWGYRERAADLSRVRGRIDLLRTETHGLLERGKVACRFDELTMDTPRNRLVRVALIELAGAREWKGLSDPNDKQECKKIKNKCHQLEMALARLGVRAIRPSSEELASDPVGWFDGGDSPMIGLAKAALGWFFPHANDRGSDREYTFSKLGHMKNFWYLYELAIHEFYRRESLENLKGWKLKGNENLYWCYKTCADQGSLTMPRMRPDIILENQRMQRRIIIDTKAKETIAQPGDLYQIYAYLRSQEGKDACAADAEGVLLYPLAEGEMMDECVRIQGHDIRFVTIDLRAETDAVIERLRSIPLNSRLHIESEAKAA